MAIWPLKDGRLVKLSEGLFQAPEPDLQIGPAALDRLIASHCPLLDLPWSVRETLSIINKEELQDIKILSPSSLRDLLQGGLLTKSAVTTKEALELLSFCISDLQQLTEPQGLNQAIILSSPSPQPASVFDQLADLVSHEGGWVGAIANNATRWRPPPGLLDPFLGTQPASRHDIGTSQMAAAAQLVLSGHSSHPTQAPAQHDNLIKACLGLPIPCSSGEVSVIGNKLLFILPPECGHEAGALLPPSASIVHHSAVSLLSKWLKDPLIRQGLSLPILSTSVLKKHLVTMLPSQWNRPDLNSRTFARPHSLSAAWDVESDGSPSPLWLLRLWKLIHGLLAPDLMNWKPLPNELSRVSDLESLPLIPLVDSRILRIRYRDGLAIVGLPSSPSPPPSDVTDLSPLNVETDEFKVRLVCHYSCLNELSLKRECSAEPAGV
jgi:hypothetical protein